MSRVLVLVEGQTEQIFIREVVAPELGLNGVYLSARLIGKPGHKGGVGPYQRARSELLALLKQSQDVYCTTMFDYYGMPDDWPGRKEARTLIFAQKPACIEQALHADIVNTLDASFNPARFMPYVQMHEFEALLFSDCALLAVGLQLPTKFAEFMAIVNECDSPEAINDHPLSAPSKRILKITPAFQKVLHGSVISKRIGLTQMRDHCPHFAEWLNKLEALRD